MKFIQSIKEEYTYCPSSLFSEWPSSNEMFFNALFWWIENSFTLQNAFSWIIKVSSLLKLENENDFSKTAQNPSLIMKEVRLGRSLNE